MTAFEHGQEVTIGLPQPRDTHEIMRFNTVTRVRDLMRAGLDPVAASRHATAALPISQWHYQSLFRDAAERPDRWWARVARQGGRVVGFAAGVLSPSLHEEEERARPEHSIDFLHVEHSPNRAAIAGPLLIDFFKSLPATADVRTAIHTDDAEARQMFGSHGFVAQGPQLAYRYPMTQLVQNRGGAA